MALDKLVDSTQLDADLTSVANAIRTKGGTNAQLAFPAEFVSAIEDIETGGGGDYVANDWADRTKPTGDITVSENFVDNSNYYYLLYARSGIDNVLFTGTGYLPDFFLSRSSVKKIVATNAKEVGASLAANCTSLEYAVFKNVHFMYGNVFSSCTNLLGVDLGGNGSNKRVGKQDFSGATKFATLVLRANAVLPLENINAFTNSPFASGKAGGTLYVPSAQIANYQAATNWSTILGYANNQILPIEGSIYETQYVDGTPIE